MTPAMGINLGFAFTQSTTMPTPTPYFVYKLQDFVQKMKNEQKLSSTFDREASTELSSKRREN
jgi:hypothetical protein